VLAVTGIAIGVDESGEPLVLTSDEYLWFDIAAAGDPGETFAAVLRCEFR
jgi:hypothetical protein